MRLVYFAASVTTLCTALILLDTILGLFACSVLLLFVGLATKLPPPTQSPPTVAGIDYKNAYFALLDYLSHSDIDFEDSFLYATDQEDDEEDDDDDSDFWKRHRPSNN